MRKAVADFRTHAQGQIDRLEGGAKEDLQRKNASLLAFDFEAVVRLKAWDDLAQIIEVCTFQRLRLRISLTAWIYRKPKG